MNEVANRNVDAERERRKAEVRAQLEAATKGKGKSKSGFMTPERKKKLRLLLRRKAAEELKRQQEVKANERRRVIAERTGDKKNFDAMTMDELRQVCERMHDRLANLESLKWDIEHEVSRKELDIHQLSTQVSDMRGKFIKPPLKRVPKYQAKIERMLLNARKEIGFTVNLKTVKKDPIEVKETKDETPEWSWKKDKQQQGDKPAQPQAQPRGSQQVNKPMAPRASATHDDDDQDDEEEVEEEEIEVEVTDDEQ